MPRYEFHPRMKGMGAVVRIGPKGGRRVVMVYQNRQDAQEMVSELNRRASKEA
jgi:hypothetical protein